MVGGVAVRQKNLPGAPFSISSVRQLLRQRCDAGVSSRCQLKSLRNEGWRRPLSHRRRAEERPLPLGRSMVGALRFAKKICRGPHFPFQASDNCCDKRCDAGVSSRCQLKSLRNEGWRRPLSHRRRAEERPLPLGRSMVGGVAVRQKNLPGAPFSISSVRQLLRQRCDAGVSSRCQLKSLRNEGWRRPLSHRRRAEERPPAPRTQHGGGRCGSPKKFAGGPIFHFKRQTIVATALRCRGFEPLPIEIIAKRRVAPAFEPQKASGRTAPAPRTQHGGGRCGSPKKFAGAPFSISSVRQLLRQRCDARGFEPLPIEIIAKRRVAPAFEPQKASGRTAPPPLGRSMVGGVAVRQKNLPGPHFPFQASDNCCDSVAMRAVSSRCQLKSLRNERWRRPLSHRRRAEEGPSIPVQCYGCLRSNRVVVLRVFST